MKAVAKQRALKLRLETGLSYTQIAKEVGVSRSTLSLWLRDFPLCPERVQFLKKEGWERGEKKRELYREAMKKKRKDREKAVYEARLADFVHLSPQAIFTAGLTLYEAEGDKKSDSAIAFTNTDPELIRFFMLWLERFLCVPQELLRFQLR